MELNEEQAAAFAAVQSGKNIFLTGPAGSGKSYVIRKIVEWAEIHKKSIAVTALTGCAALLLGNKAKTLHSWAGVGLGRESVDVLVANILKRPQNKRKWKKTEILIVDEVSMMTPEFFDKLDQIGKRVRSSGKLWGGIQLILCGDFFQLPPVIRGMSGETMLGRFAFESPIWRISNLQPMLLTKIERQTDAAFQTVLNECRIGQPSPESIALLKTRQGLDWKANMIRPTLLFSRNADVDSINEKNVAAIGKPLRMYEARTEIVPEPEDPFAEIPSGETLDRYVQRLDNDANYAPHLELCIGCQVMLLVNMDIAAGLVNGSRGVIIDFRVDGAPIVQFMQGDPIAIPYHSWQSNDTPVVHRQQIPLRVAYAITIHKSQGATLDCALVDIGSSTFEYGQAYVALSRVRDLASLYIWNLNPTKIKAHPAVIAYYENLLETMVVPEAPTPVLDLGKTLSGLSAEITDAGWRTVVDTWFQTPTGMDCLQRVAERMAATKVYPERADILSALRVTPLQSVKVVILGQDPYHGPSQAHGLSFSVAPGIALPPSLRNIRKELIADLAMGDQVWPASCGTLTGWAAQGVLLLNTILTVDEGNPASHAGFGWEDLTLSLLRTVVHARKDDPLVFIAWGKFAQSVLYKLTLGKKHTILAGVHPSPLSAHSGFFGSKPFTKTNALLEAEHATPIVWNVSAAATVAVAVAGAVAVAVAASAEDPI